METILKLSDFHVPHHDETAIDVALKVGRAIKPKIVILDEVVDFYALSKFNKDPRQKLCLQENLDISHSILAKIRKSFPTQRIIMLESNHDRRLEKYLNSKAEELRYLRNLSLYSLLDLGTLCISYMKDFVYKDVLFKHGEVVRNQSGYTARGERDREGMSGISGHTHRLGMHFKTLRGGSYVWVEGGCLCLIDDVEYIEGTADWQQGVAGVSFEDNGKMFFPFIIPIIDHKAIYGGKVYQ